MLWRIIQAAGKTGWSISKLFYFISFLVILVAGLLLIFKTYDILGNKAVIIVSALIPVALSLGLVYDLARKIAPAYLAFAVIGLLALAITRYTGPANLATIVLIIVHATAGLLIFLLPIWAVAKKVAPAGFIGVTIGGALIGLGGIALAFLKSDSQLLFLSADVVFKILAPILLAMTLAFTWGLVSWFLKR
jgi:hypothetical protein